MPKYGLGVTFDQLFAYDTEFNTGANSSNGLTSPASPSTNNNGNATNFANPSFTNTGNVQVSIRIFGVPEPATSGLGVVGLLTIVGMLRKTS